MSFLSTLLGGISSIFEKIPVVGEAIAGGVNAVTGEISAKDALDDERNWNATQAQINRDFQKNERLEAQQFNLDMWNLNNQYNSPAAQLQRATDAGINANSVIGGLDAGTAKQVTTSPAGGTPTAAAGSLASHLLLQDAQIQNLMANTRKTDAEADEHQYNLSWNKLTEEQRFQALVNMNDKTKADIAKIFSDIGMNDFSKDLQEKQYRWFAAKSEEEIKVMQEQVTLLFNQSQDVLKSMELKDSEIALNEERAITERFDQRLKHSQAELNDAVQTGQEVSNNLEQIKLDFCNITGLPIGVEHTEALFALFKAGRFEEYMRLLGQISLDNIASQAGIAFSQGNENIRQANTLQHNSNADYHTPYSGGHNYVNSYNQRHGYYNP